jgi:thiamine biosynthesis protein ThiS
MKLVINGEGCEVQEGLTVRALLTHLDLGKGLVAVEVNKAIVVRAHHETHVLKDGDTVELVQLVGGG